MDGVQEKMAALKKGTSPVVERGHTVILGWTAETVNVVREIALANASDGGGVIAVLSDRDKVELDEELRASLRRNELFGTRVVFRNGSRLRPSDLHKVSTATARAVMVVSDSALEPHTADAEVLQAVLNLSTLRLPSSTNVVAEVRVNTSEAVMHLVSAGRVATVPSHDLCGALMLQFARQPGLAAVYSTVLGFEGSEFYCKQWPELEGVAFADIALRMPDAIPLGILDADGTCVLNPPAHRQLAPGDSLVVLAEDDDSYEPREAAAAAAAQAALTPADAACFIRAGAKTAGPETFLFFGWRRDFPAICLLLNRLVASGSELHCVCALPLAEREAQLADACLAADALTNLKLVHHVANVARGRGLDNLPICTCTSVIIASDAANTADVIRSDSQALMTLLQLRGLHAASRHLVARRPSVTTVDGSVHGSGHATLTAVNSIHLSGEVYSSAAMLPVVVEVLDPRTQLTVTESPMGLVSEFMHSNQLVSKILAMVSEEKSIKVVLDQLLGGTGTQFAVVPAAECVVPGSFLSFAELAQYCSVERRATLCGVIESHAAAVINPPDKCRRRTWEGCGLVMVTTDERLKTFRSSISGNATQFSSK